MNVAITGIGLTSGLGDGVKAHREKMAVGQDALSPLSTLLGEDSPYADAKAAWIENREIMLSRKWAPASMLSLHVARQAVADAGLSAEELRDMAVIVGSSRGNVAGWVSEWPMRRPFKLMAASNSMHGELASAVSIELGIRGPWQVISSGCAASLDAMGMGSMMIQQGMVKRALVIGVELPLIPEVLQAYADTGVLASSGVNDPYSADTSGLFPAEAGAALVIEAVTEQSSGSLKSQPQMTGYWCNSDADSPIGMPDDGSGLRGCLEQALAGLEDEPAVAAICPHASGTLLHAKAELAALKAVLPVDQPISLHPLKPYTGHSVGANGVLDCAILASYLRDRELPPNLHGITCPGAPFSLDAGSLREEGSTILKIAVGMGGHNSIVSLRSPSA